MSRSKSKTQETERPRKTARKTDGKAARKTHGGPKGGKKSAPQAHQGEGSVARVEGRRGFPVFESIGQAAAVLGAPVALLKAAKRKGCRAFLSGSRVDSGELLPFLFALLTQGNELPAGVASPAEWLTIEKAKREAIRRQADEKAMMPTIDAQRQASFACSFLFGELERWERELPPALAGLPAIEIMKRLHQVTERTRQQAKAKFEAIGKG